MKRVSGNLLLVAAACLFASVSHAASPWGRVLNPTGEAPLGSFKAVYINTQSPREIVASEDVRDIAINYSWAQFHDIKSEDFGAYWVGRIEFAEDVQRVLEVNQSRAKSRVFIDGQLVYEGGEEARKPVTFAKGIHLVEVEFINGWHTAEFKLALNPPVDLMSHLHVSERLRSLGIENPAVHYVAVYESSARDLTIGLDVARSKQPVVLVLSSYSGVSWVIREANSGDVRAVVYVPAVGTEIRGVDADEVALLPVDGSIGTYQVEARCSCAGGHFHCENDGNLIATKAVVEQVTGAPLVSFNGAYSKDAFAIPGMLVDAAALESNRVAAKRQKVERQECERRGNPDFDALFEESSDEG